jgi:hypothetical protein
VATQNQDSLRTFVAEGRPEQTVPVRPLDRSATLRYADGATQTVELYYGSTYLSQSSRALRIPPGVEQVVLRGRGGERRTVTP